LYFFFFCSMSTGSRSDMAPPAGRLPQVGFRCKRPARLSALAALVSRRSQGQSILYMGSAFSLKVLILTAGIRCSNLPRWRPPGSRRRQGRRARSHHTDGRGRARRLAGQAGHDRARGTVGGQLRATMSSRLSSSQISSTTHIMRASEWSRFAPILSLLYPQQRASFTRTSDGNV
jgi:hypothetical protein